MKPTTPRQAAGANAIPAPQGWVLRAAVILAVTLLVYLPAIRGGFCWDDDVAIVHNRMIHTAAGPWQFFVTTETPDYYPVGSSVLWLEWLLWGGRAAGYHVVNALLHALGAVMIWRVLRRLNVPGAWLGGLLFAVHPVAAASAAWITEIKNTLSLVFCAGSLLLFLRFDERANRKFGKQPGENKGKSAVRRRPNLPISQSPTYLWSVLLFLVALLCKTSVVILPVVLLLCAWWRRGRISRKDLVRSLPFFALSLAMGLVTVWFQQQNAIHGWPARPEGFASRVAASGWMVWFYLSKALLPFGLCAIYPRWKVDGGSLAAFVPLLLLAGGMVFLWIRRKSWGRGPFFAAACFLAALAPVLGFLDMSFMQYSLVADHFQYLAMAAVLALAASFLVRAAGPGLSGRPAAFLAAAGCVAILGTLTWRRATLYGDEKFLWQDNVAQVPGAWGAWNNLGKALSESGAPKEAIPCFDKAIALSPDPATCHYNRGIAWSKTGEYGRAIADYDYAISSGEKLADAYYNRGLAHARTNDLAEALRDYDQAISNDGEYEAAYNNRGLVHERMGRLDQAVQDYTQAIELTPDNPGIYSNRARAYYKSGEYGKAWTDVKMSEALGGRPNPEFLKALEQAARRPE